jgi:cytochrome c553
MRWHTSASPVTACANCHITSGSSGEPKFRQLVTAIGTAPVAATLR